MYDTSDKTIVAPNSAPEELPESGTAENRAKTRYSFTASAEVYELKSQTRVVGRCSDLSIGGCYIDTLAPFPVGSAVRVRIECDALEFQATALVIYAHASMGMGISFTEIRPEYKAVLMQWIAKLRGDVPAEPATFTPAPQTQAQEADAALRSVLKELITLLVRKKIFNEKEGAELQLQISS